MSNSFLTVAWNKQWHCLWPVYSISWFRWWVLAREGRWEQDVSLCHFSSCTLLENLVSPVNIPKVLEIAPLYFQIISMNPKLSPYKRGDKKQSFRDTELQSWDLPRLIACNVFGDKGPLRHPSFPKANIGTVNSVSFCVDCLWFGLAWDSLHCSHKQHTTRQKLSCWWLLVTKFWQH